jgi:hypothetical protein
MDARVVSEHIKKDIMPQGLEMASNQNHLHPNQID